MDKRYFSDKVVEWYTSNQRDLPWRRTKDPYKIWLSEVILQQTRVNQGTPYYKKFLSKFPTLAHLAAASEQEVLREWQGLGYYTRARNLHKCARVIQHEFKGSFPASFDLLKKLPGIGDYTAAAIASISFHEPVAVVDGNVFRVLARVFGLETPINSPAGKKQFSILANELLDSRQPDVFNQAMMEFGALVCVPKNPDCGSCPLQKNCFASLRELQAALPVKNVLRKTRHRYFHYFVVQHRNSLLMQKRLQKDIWHGLYDFYRVESSKPKEMTALVKQDPFLKKIATRLPAPIAKFKHVLSHQVIHASFTVVILKQKNVTLPAGMRFYSLSKIAELPKAVLITRYLSEQKLL